LLLHSASWPLAALIVAAVLLSAGACGGDGEPTDKTTAGFIAFRQATSTPTIATEATVGPLVSTRPCGGRPWIKPKGVLICLPNDATLSGAITECPPVPIVGTPQVPCEGDRMFDVITRGDSEVWIGTESGEITKWDVAPEDEEEFNRLIREPLEEAGY
jgi:hypothetical protein